MGKRTRKIKIEEFNHVQLQFPNLEMIVMKSALDTANDLRRNKYQKWVRNRKRNRYDSGWTIEMTENSKKRTLGTVYNRTNWQLTWLLENGHFIVNKLNGVGWARPHRHIYYAYEKGKDEYIKAMSKDLDIEVELR